MKAVSSSSWRGDTGKCEQGESALEPQDTRDSSKVFPVYRRDSCFEDLAGLTRECGLELSETRGTGESGSTKSDLQSRKLLNPPFPFNLFLPQSRRDYSCIGSC